MTDKEMSKLADIIVDKIIERQKAYDEEFKADIQLMVDENTNIEFGTITQDELIIEEIDGLQERLDTARRKRRLRISKNRSK